MSVSTAVSARSRAGLFPLVAAGILWGTGGLLGALVQDRTGLSPIAVAAYRLGVGGAILVAVSLVVRRAVPRGRAARRRIGAIGALAAVFQASYFAAVSASSVVLATLVTIGAAPVLVAGFGHVTGRARLDTRRVATLALAITGLVILVGVPTADTSGVLAGAVLALLAATAFAAVTLVTAEPVPGLDTITATGYGFLGGAALLALPAAATGLTFTPAPADLLAVALLGLAPTALAYALFFHGLITAGAATAAVLSLLEPLTATVLAVALLGERLTALAWTGAALLAVALILTATAPTPGSVTRRGTFTT
ncbi:DMT family transporter [Nocardia asteroides]|uniref:DMT family transporter n=1 Tax=Nocardia asteroides TaxID=1824 RepID=UPI001E48A76B|nr:EamA family transporter [Nocardia asteroides]UGT56262.1 DMT family transporter [Nocardia asteroides]